MTLDRRQLLQGFALMAATDAAAQTSTPTTASRHYQWPASERVRLWPGDAPGHGGFRRPTVPADWPSHFLRGIEVPELHVFRPERPDGRAILVCPGGAYLFVSIENEGLDVARTFNSMGITVFVLAYRLPCEGWASRSDAPLQDAQRAMRLLRHRATEFGIDPERLGVLGFSAGGHLAACLTTGWQEAIYTPLDAADQLSARPAQSALIYPVVTLTNPLTHIDSRRYLLGETPTPTRIAERSPEQQVRHDTPRCFIAHAADDGAVPVGNALLFQHALQAASIGCELHIFESGDHAFGVGREGTGSALWPRLYERWLGA